MNKPKTQIQLEVVTSMLSKGSNNELEIRIPEIKSAMRFWWRGLNYFNIDKKTSKIHEEYIKNMKEEEGKVFGDLENQSSPLYIKFFQKNSIQESRRKVVGIKGYRCTIKPTYDFKLNFYLKYSNYITYSLQKYIELLEIVSVLGGIGQRSRKGHGCFAVREVNMQDYNIINYNELNIQLLCEKIHKLFMHDTKPIYEIKKSEYIDGLKVIKRKLTPICNYPYVEEIYIGEKELSIKELVSKNDKWTSKLNSNDYRCVGIHKSSRYSCPVYVSAIPAGKGTIRTVITILKNTEIDIKDKNTSSQYMKYVRDIFSEFI